MASPATLGNLVRLVPLALSELPAHPALTAQPPVSNGPVPRPEGAGDLGPPETGRPRLLPFVKEILDQATSFVDDVLPRTFSETNEKRSSPAAAKVKILKKELDRQQLSRIPWATGRIPRQVPLSPGLRSEAWFARRSCHADQSQTGTASLAEFERGLLVDHSEHEQEYTPDVYDARHVLNWDVETVSTEFAIGDPYSQVRMCIYEMCHKLPWPLAPRVFPVLVALAKMGDGFIVLQVPISVESLPASFYSNGRNLREGDSALKRKKPVLGWEDTHLTRQPYADGYVCYSVYTSIERCRMLPDQTIEWTMATASDAKGWLPMWVQKLGIPGAIAKDVGLFIGWIAKQRRSGAGERR